MKKKCANGGVVKKPMTMQEQLASVRGKVRPGYEIGGAIYRNGSSFSDVPTSGSVLSGIASDVAPLSPQLPPTQNQSALNGIPAKPVATMGATAIQSGEYPVNAPGSTPQSLGTLGKPDYSAGPRQGGFVYEDGTPRPMQQAAAQNPLADQISSGQALANLSNTERYKLGGSGTAAEASAINAKNDILQGMNASIAKSNPAQSFVSPEQPAQQIQGSRRRRNSQPQGVVSFASGGPVFRDGNTFSDRPLMPEPGNHPQRIANPRPMPRPVAAPQPVRIPLPPPEYPQERVRPVPFDSGAPVGTYPGVAGVADAIMNRKVKNADAKDYAAGGMVKFAGKGGPRDDKIPVKVAGQEINVSNGENAVILPAKTAANPAALYAIGGIIQATNDGRKPKMGMEKGGKYKDGAYPYDDKPPPTAQQVYAPTYAAPGSIIGALPEGGYLRTPEGRAQVMDALSGKGLRPDVGILGPRNASPAASVQATSPAQTYSNEGRPSALGQAYESYRPPAQGITAGVANADARMQNVAANDGMTTTQMGAGFDPTKLQMAPGYGMATNAAGKTIAVGPSEYVGSDGQPTSRWTDTQQYKDAIARNQADKLRLAEMQSQRLGADPMAVQKASQGIAQSVMQAPLDARVKQQQIQQGDVAAQNANELRALYEAHKTAKTPEERSLYEEAIRVRTGKDNKLLAVDLGSDKVTDEMGNVKGIPRGQGVINQTTGQWVPQPGTAPKTSFSKAEVDSAIKAGASKEAVAARIKSMGMNPKDYGL